MKKPKKIRKPSGSNPIAKNAWKQNKPKVVPDKHKTTIRKAIERVELETLVIQALEENPEKPDA